MRLLEFAPKQLRGSAEDLRSQFRLPDPRPTGHSARAPFVEGQFVALALQGSRQVVARVDGPGALSLLLFRVLSFRVRVKAPPCHLRRRRHHHHRW